MHRFRLSDFDFELPQELVAQTPTETRSESRLLVVGSDGTGGPGGSSGFGYSAGFDSPTEVRGDDAKVALSDRMFADLPSLLDAGDLVVFNDTRVIRARLQGVKDSGGRIEVMIERLTGARDALAQVRASHAPRAGSTIAIGAFRLEIIGRDDRLFHVRCDETTTIEAILEAHGEVPLPPYITRAASHASPSKDDAARVSTDAERYQTIYARAPGAVAAPTAGLHFDPPLLDALRSRGIETAFLTLHVGLGTFLPVQTETLSEHRMHSEWFDLPASTIAAIERTRARGSRIVAVGTTTLRALESAADENGSLRPGPQETALFITPGYRFRVIDRLLTNFHLPKSTLLMLVSAFAGYDAIRAAYAHAIDRRYRFFSYGDAMLLTKSAESLTTSGPISCSST
jgi:S-adenosylmethionine:tRNA ribosyltransferase-isomerase